MRFLNLSKVAICGSLLLLAVGCAVVPVVPLSPEQAVKARAQARWDALVAGQIEKAFEFITPSGRSTLPFDVFRGRLSGTSWRKASVTSATCEPEVCDVNVTLEVDVLPNLPQPIPISEKWLLVDGQWWFVYRG